MSIHIEAFRAGTWRKANDYRYFLPDTINRQWLWHDATINTLLGDAMSRIGELNAWGRLVPNTDLFIRMQAHAESWASNRIEGTQTALDEALLPESTVAPEQRDDWREIQNYTQALQEALDSDLPVSSRLMKDAHLCILQSVRGQHKNPGHYRTSQNWIGGSTPGNAHFVPPHHQHVDDLMGDLEKFINNDRIEMPPLVRIAIAHYQFETIHPFLDGNGRIGRLLIPVYLARAGVLHKPLFYPSAQLEQGRSQYYDRLDGVRGGNMLEWLQFFLRISAESAASSIRILEQINTMYDNTRKLIHETMGKRASPALKILDGLMQNPVINTGDAQQQCHLQRSAANNLLQAMQKAGILQVVPGTARPRLYWFRAYLDIFGNR